MGTGTTLEEYDLPTAPKEVDPHQPLVFKIDGVVHKALDRLWDRIQIAIANVRGPDPDIEEQRYTQEEVRFLMNAAARDSKRNYGGNHSDGKGKLLHWLLGLNTAILGWAAIQFIHYGERLTRLEIIACQANPAICARLTND